MSAIDGILEVGDLVWQQMYDPQTPAWDSSLQERIEHGKPYGPPRLMRIIATRPYTGTQCYACSWSGRRLDGSPCERCNGTAVIIEPHTTVQWTLATAGLEGKVSERSFVSDNWCTLEHAVDDSALW